jgi:alpha-L-fucosidase
MISKRCTGFLFVTLLTVSAISSAADRTSWYREAKFGMFIHWGPYSLASVEASWPIMTPEPGTIGEADYRRLYQRFNPEKLDPSAWVRLAKAAGQRYMVFTSKHHDGFCMFDSAYTDYKVTRSPYAKDIVAQLAAACKAARMPLGFYYSPPDMNHPGFRDTSKLASTNWRGEPARPEWVLYLGYMGLQLTELLTRYGDVAIVWFDGLGDPEKYDGRRFHKLIHELQPAALINNRLGLPGDYSTPEQFIPKDIPRKSSQIRLAGLEEPAPATKVAAAPPPPEDFQLWETCMTINDTWAYNVHDKNYKSATQLIRMLIEVASKGGNLLLNVGPTPEGTIQPEFEERLLEIGRWLEVNGESIYGTTYGPLQNLPFGKMTAKGKNLYLHVFDWPKDRKLVLTGLQARATAAKLLRGGERLRFTQAGDRLTLEVPVSAPDPHASVLTLSTK